MTNGIPHRGIPFFVADDVRYNFSVYDVVRKGMPTSMRQGFDNEKYIELQAANIRKRIAQFGGKLYLEFGGKLFDDYHASRVLPGFEPDTKFRMFESLVDDVEIVIAINANHIEKGKTRGDLGIPYDEDVLRLIDVFRSRGFLVGSVVHHPIRQSARRRRLPPAASSNSASPAACTTRSPDTRYDIERIVSDDGYGKNEYIETTPTARRGHRARPGLRQDSPRACLSSTTSTSAASTPAMPNTRRSPSGTFRSTIPSTSPTRLPPSTSTTPISSTPSIWRRTARPPSTTTATSRAFPVLKAMMERIMGESPYQSPTDMGVNMAGLRHCATTMPAAMPRVWKSCAATSPPPCT